MLSWIFLGMCGLSAVSALLLHRGGALSAAVMEGAQAGITLVLGMSGSVCLWCGVGRLLERSGVTGALSRLIRPVLFRLFPSCRENEPLRSSLTANICANFLGIGNAATPMGIQAARHLAQGKHIATDELCRLIVLNTASIQLIPGNVAAIRASLGSSAPFDILPMVWISSLLSAGLGVCAAVLLGKLWRR